MAELIELTCPSCGAKLEADRSAAHARCTHCGTELVIERKAMVVAPPVAAEVGPEKCPKCGRVDRVQKVSSVHSSGLSRTSFRGDVWTKDGFDPVSMSGHSQTELSRLFSPPKAPSPVTWVGRIVTAWGLGFLLFLGGLGGACLCFSASNLLMVGPSVTAELAAEPVGYGAFGLAGLASLPLFMSYLFSVFLWGGLPLLVGNRMRRSKRCKYPVEKERWERAAGRWQRLYYCARDDGVFIPGETSFIPIDKMQEFLYAD
jgi:predicted RNA-binding Zn-ribbon protein involved in translation (DUF1610 family)